MTSWSWRCDRRSRRSAPGPRSRSAVTVISHLPEPLGLRRLTERRRLRARVPDLVRARRDVARREHREAHRRRAHDLTRLHRRRLVHDRRPTDRGEQRPHRHTCGRDRTLVVVRERSDVDRRRRHERVPPVVAGRRVTRAHVVRRRQRQRHLRRTVTQRGRQHHPRRCGGTGWQCLQCRHRAPHDRTRHQREADRQPQPLHRSPNRTRPPRSNSRNSSRHLARVPSIREPFHRPLAECSSTVSRPGSTSSSARCVVHLPDTSCGRSSARYRRDARTVARSAGSV